jgi:ATP-binding cassette subfamily B protein
MPSSSYSGTDIKKLLSNGWWALRLIWSTNASLSLGLTAATFARGIVPAGLALFGRGLIDAVVSNRYSGPEGMNAILPWVFLGFGLTVLEAMAPLVEKFCTHRLKDDVNLRITSDILVHSAKLDAAFFENPANRDIISRAQQSPAEHFMMFVLESHSLASSLLQTFSLIGILMMIEPLILLVIAPFAVPYLFFNWRLSKTRYHEEYRRAPQRRWTSYFVSLLTSRRSLVEVKLLDLAPLLLSRFRSLMTEFRDGDRKIFRRSFGGSSLFAFVTTIAFYTILVRVIANAFKGILTVGDVALFGGGTSRLRFTVETAIHSLSNAMEQTLFISNLIEFFNKTPRTIAGSLIPPSNRGEVEFKNVSFTYPGSTEPALRGISLHIRPGEIVALVGENGAGKTTLVKLLAGLYDPDEGCIDFEGVDLKTISLTYLHEHLAFVVQDFARYEATAADNIAYGDWRRMVGNPHRVEQTARLAGVHSMIESMPKKYDTMLGRLFGEHDLSRGEWQKLAIARALARNASILILDEPAASLSVKTEYELFCRFRDISKGKTTILISHRLSTARIADRILVMDKGYIVENGTHRELIAHSGHYASLYSLHRRQMVSSSPKTRVSNSKANRKNKNPWIG